MSTRNRPILLSLMWRAVTFEFRLYRSLFRWATRRPAVPAGAEAVGYSRAVTPVMSLWIFASAVEMLVVHLLVPWPTVRIVLLVLSAWGLVWMLGYLASLKVYPHLISDSGVRIRHGASVDIVVPWNVIARVAVLRRGLPSSMRTLQPRQTERGTDLQVGVSGEVNVHAALDRQLDVPTANGLEHVTGLGFWVDEPDAFVARVREQLALEAAKNDQSRG